MQVSSNHPLRYSNIQNNKIGFTARVPKFKVFGNVPDSFVKEIEAGFKAFPEKIFDKLEKEFNLEIRIAPKGSDAYPDIPFAQKFFKEKLVPGTKYTGDRLYDGFTWVTADNIHHIDFFSKPKSFIKIFLKYLFTNGEAANRGTVTHELTHKVDKLGEKITGTAFSQTNEFKNAVKKDLTRFPEKKELYPDLVKKYNQTNIDYMTQKSTPDNPDSRGLKEIFANCGASLITGTNQEIDKNIKFMEKFFSESYEHVKKIFHSLETK